MWSSIANKWWSVQVRLQICDAVEVHYYDAKYSHIELHWGYQSEVQEILPLAFYPLLKMGSSHREKETAKKTIMGDAA